MDLQKNCLIGLLSFVFLLFTVSSHPHLKEKREAENPNTEAQIKYCHRSMPCAWAVYVPFTRTIDHFIYNTCQCKKNQECLNTEDDLSVSAYVYMCRIPTAADKEQLQQPKQ